MHLVGTPNFDIRALFSCNISMVCPRPRLSLLFALVLRTCILVYVNITTKSNYNFEQNLTVVQSMMNT